MNDPKFTYQADPDCGLIEFFVDGELITTWIYEDLPDQSLEEFKMIFNLGRNYNPNNQA